MDDNGHSIRMRTIEFCDTHSRIWTPRHEQWYKFRSVMGNFPSACKKNTYSLLDSSLNVIPVEKELKWDLQHYCKTHKRELRECSDWQIYNICEETAVRHRRLVTQWMSADDIGPLYAKIRTI